MTDRANGRTRGIVFLVGAAAVACGSLASAQECDPGLTAVGDRRLGSAVLAMQAFDDGSGPALYAGGRLYLDGDPIGGLARWDGQEWTPLGLGGGNVDSLATYDDGSGPALYASGGFRVIADPSITGFARWDGHAWSTVGDWRARPEAMAVYDDGTGPALYAAGWINEPATGRSESIARWDGERWSFLGEHNFNGAIETLTVFDDGTGPVLLAGGQFTVIDGQTVNHVASWDGSDWSPLGEGVPAKVLDFAIMEDDGGQTLFATGGIIPRRWDPDTRTWTRLADAFDANIEALEAFDDGRGMALFAAGSFSEIDGEPSRGFARWDGEGWEPGDRGVTIVGGRSLATFDDGDGPALFFGGALFFEGEAGVSAIARWGCDASCPADLDADGSLTIFDFLAFQNAFDAGDPRADFDGDGELTIFDFLAFQTAFDAGCE
ncbi:MAG: GC-type dockerin domain-anchored protein [Phycisphaerales bacterium JB060]